MNSWTDTTRPDIHTPLHHASIAVPPLVQRALPWGAAALLCVLLLLGGGVPRYVRLLLEAVALFGLMGLLWLQLFYRPIRREALLPAVFALLVLLVPALQLVPLPYGIWSSLPGREFVVDAYATAGLGQPWRPVSLDPEATVDSALTLLAPLAVLFATFALDPRRRVWLVRVLIGIGTISAVLALLQAAMPGEASLYLSDEPVTASPSGLINNRNLQCDLLLVAMLLAAWQTRVLKRREQGSTTPIRGLEPWHFGLPLIGFLAIMTALTQSRFGVTLLAPVLLICVGVIFGGGLRREVLIGLVAIVASAAAAALLAPGLVEKMAARFDQQGDSRIDTLPDLLFAAEQYVPVGSGVGTFVPVFKAVESLDTVQTAYTNHAHNEYLEVLIETGLVGAILMLVFLIAFVIRAWRVARQGGNSSYLWLQRVCAVGSAVILLHALVDYPLRAMSLEVSLALMCAILFSRTPPPEPRMRTVP